MSPELGVSYELFPDGFALLSEGFCPRGCFDHNGKPFRLHRSKVQVCEHFRCCDTCSTHWRLEMADSIEGPPTPLIDQHPCAIGCY